MADRRRVFFNRASLAVILLVASAWVARMVPVHGILPLLLAVASPYLTLLAASAGIIAVRTGSATVAIAAMLVTALGLGAQIPWYYFGQPGAPGQHSQIRVLSSNLRLGQADPDEFVLLARRHADVVTVSELTTEAARNLRGAGITTSFPYSRLIPEPGAGGIGVWSRYSLAELPDQKHRDVVATAARLSVPGVREDPIIVSIHVHSPVADGADTVHRWRNGLLEAKDRLSQIAAGAESAAVLVGGDFNSTPDVKQFRDLLTNGYRDAVQQAGSGFAPTFPAGGRFPPLVTIDHVLTRNATAASLRTVTVPGSDHRAVLASVLIPTD